MQLFCHDTLARLQGFGEGCRREGTGLFSQPFINRARLVLVFGLRLGVEGYRIKIKSQLPVDITIATPFSGYL